MLTIAYIKGEPQKRERKPSDKQKLHQLALGLVAKAKVMDKAKAAKLFEKDYAELAELERERDAI